MRLWDRLFPAPEPTGLPSMLALDLKRVRWATAALGAPRSTLNVKRLNSLDELHLINRSLGERLARCNPRLRVATASTIASADRVLPLEIRRPAGELASPEITSVRETGCAGLGRTLDDVKIADIHSHLGRRPVLLAHDAHMAEKQVPSLADVPPEMNYACYDYLDLWSAPHILELASQDRIIDLVQGYLGGTPTLYSINAFWSFPNRQPHAYSQVFHRDWEDYRSLVVFTLLTPVETPEEGAHYYVGGSHEVERLEASLRARGIDADVEALSSRGEGIAPLAMKLFEHSARRFDGPAGQSFCGDGYGLHRAVVPQSHPRLLLWMRFGSFFNETVYKIPPLANDHEAAQRVLQRIPADPRRQFVFRYLVEALRAVGR
jgi:hypothetical protein